MIIVFEFYTMKMFLLSNYSERELIKENQGMGLKLMGFKMLTKFCVLINWFLHYLYIHVFKTKT